MSQILKYTGLIILIGFFIAGGILSKDGEYGDFNYSIAVVWWATGAIACVLFIAIAEVIDLLQGINDKLASSLKKSGSLTTNTNVSSNDINA